MLKLGNVGVVFVRGCFINPLGCWNESCQMRLSLGKLCSVRMHKSSVGKQDNRKHSRIAHFEARKHVSRAILFANICNNPNLSNSRYPFIVSFHLLNPQQIKTVPRGGTILGSLPSSFPNPHPPSHPHVHKLLSHIFNQCPLEQKRSAPSIKPR